MTPRLRELEVDIHIKREMWFRAKKAEETTLHVDYGTATGRLEGYKQALADLKPVLDAVRQGDKAIDKNIAIVGGLGLGTSEGPPDLIKTIYQEGRAAQKALRDALEALEDQDE